MKSSKIITLYEHQSLKLGQISETELRSLVKFYGDGVPYYSLINNGVKFCEYVGVLQIEGLIIEVLPKADKREDNENYWRDILISMLRVIGVSEAHSPTFSELNLKPNSVLEFYFELFIREVEALIHKGLVKRYRKKSGNCRSLKGSLIFSNHIKENLIHKEKFYVNYTSYDTQHLFHQLLFECLLILKNLNRNSILSSRINNLLISFPEQKRIKVTAGTYRKIIYNRKTEGYKTAISIAELILLNFHPDLTHGENSVLALMFDMNRLWEKFIYVTLKKKLSGFMVQDQVKVDFWKNDEGSSSCMIPDIVLQRGDESFVLDTKWKNLNGYTPSPNDLRQLFAYSYYFMADKVALVYPGVNSVSNGYYTEPNSDKLRECGVIEISVGKKSINSLMNNIVTSVSSFINPNFSQIIHS